MAKTPKSVEQEEADQVKAIRDDLDYDFRQWESVYKEGDVDAKFIAGDPWDAQDVRQRDDAGRPHLSFDELGQYVNQAINDIRAKPAAPKFAPTGDGANDETARFYEGLARQIDYDSNAQLADTTAFENCLQRSFGYERIVAEYEHPTSFAQRLRIESIPNPNCVVPDADALRPDGSDWTRLSFIEKYSRDEFKREFPGAQFKDFSREQVNIGSAWGSENHVQVVEFWRLTMKPATVQQWELQPTTRNPAPQIKTIVVGKDRQPDRRYARLIQERETELPEVTSCYTNGLELLEKRGKKVHPWAGDAIPFTSCYGKVLWLNKDGAGAERTILSMTRLARSPYMAYCFAVTSLIEAIGLITKNPYMAYEGTLSVDHMNLIAKSMHEPVAVLLSKPFIPEMPNQLMPLLQRNPLSIDLSSYLQATEICRQAIRAAMGMGYLPTPAQRNNEKSGIALSKIEESGQRGTYHFKDAYYMMLRRRLEIEENLIDRLYDTPREVNIRTPKDDSERWRINGPKAKPDEERVLPSIKGRHSVTITIGPQEGSQREAANAFVDTFVTSPLMQALEPPKRDKLIALAIKARNIGPMGDEMAEVIAPPEPDQKGMIPLAQAQAMAQQGQQVIDGLMKEIEELKRGAAVKQLELQTKATLAEKADATKREITATQEAGDMAREELRAKTDLELEAMRQAGKRAEVVSEERQQDVEHAHDAAKTIMGQQHASASQAQAEEAAERQANRAAEPEGSDAG